jgi:peptidoglycan/xylan/chitin deacetylase (PgdA/CDA1 family)
MSWAEIAEVAREGVEIGSHALDHDSLWAKAPAAVVEQLSVSRQLIRRHTAGEAAAIAYPHGAADALVRQCARQAGYLLGFGTRPGPVTLAASPYDLPRVTVEPDWTPAELSNRLDAPSTNR